MLVTRQMLDVFQRRESLGLAAMLAQVLHATVAMLAAAREESIDMAAAALLNEVRGRGASLPAALAAELDGLAAPANAVAVPMPDLPPAVGDAVVAVLTSAIPDATAERARQAFDRAYRAQSIESSSGVLAAAAVTALRELAEAADIPLADVVASTARSAALVRLPAFAAIADALSAFAIPDRGEAGSTDVPEGLAGDPEQSGNQMPSEPDAVDDGWPWSPDGDDAAMPRDLIFVDDAGLVLLWPFLTHYFDRVGLLEDGQFTSREAAARGVMLLHYMATTNTETEEPRLTLPKLLCGVPFSTPVTPRIALTEMEETVSEELLNVVCQNWPALRNSSVEALRETFLLRDGSLSWLEERIWVLTVAAKPFDMLLTQLPWTISTFKTPLMEHAMMVQWGPQ